MPFPGPMMQAGMMARRMQMGGAMNPPMQMPAGGPMNMEVMGDIGGKSSVNEFQSALAPYIQKMNPIGNSQDPDKQARIRQAMAMMESGGQLGSSAPGGK